MTFEELLKPGEQRLALCPGDFLRMHAVAVEDADIGLSHHAPSAPGVESVTTHVPAHISIVQLLTVPHRRWPGSGIRVGFTDDRVELPDDVGEGLGVLLLAHPAMITLRANQLASNRPVRDKSGKRPTLSGRCSVTSCQLAV